MKTTFKFISLFLAAALPSTFAAEIVGADLPAALESFNIFAALVASLVLMTVFADYNRTALRTKRLVTRAEAPKATNPLAA